MSCFMRSHKSRVGQHVRVQAGLVIQTVSLFEVTACLPADEAGQPQYRVKGLTEIHERMVKEFQLAPARAVTAEPNSLQ
jgi:hypothetical protein